MSMDKDTVRRVANLARIAVTEADVDRLAPALSNIIKFAEQLSEVNTDNIEPLANVANIDLRLRDDVVNDGGNADKVLANGPETLQGFYVVPKVVE